MFAFGMTIYELLTMRPPYDELPRKDPAILHKAVRDGRRPRLTDKVIILHACIVKHVYTSHFDENTQMFIYQVFC